jgi:hypothetical protein
VLAQVVHDGIARHVLAQEGLARLGRGRDHRDLERGLPHRHGRQHGQQQHGHPVADAGRRCAGCVSAGHGAFNIGIGIAFMPNTRRAPAAIQPNSTCQPMAAVSASSGNEAVR